SKKYTDIQGEKLARWDNITGWLGFTDQYWATMRVASRGEHVNAQSDYTKPNNIDEYKSSFVTATPITVAAGQTATDKSYVFAGAKEEAVISSYESEYKIDRFDLMIDWGWFFFLTKP